MNVFPTQNHYIEKQVWRMNISVYVYIAYNGFNFSHSCLLIFGNLSADLSFKALKDFFSYENVGCAPRNNTSPEIDFPLKLLDKQQYCYNLQQFFYNIV